MNRNYASINDQPIDGASRDLLKNERYATGLYDFIRRADTPLTIGIQGGWGSGKTSLINLLRSKLGSNPAPMQAVEDGSICLVINAWEHSLFQEDNRAAVAFALLDGIVRSMMRAIRESELFDTATKDRILDTRIPETLRKVGKLVTGLAVFGTNMVTNGLVKEVAEATVGSSSAPQNESIAEQVRELRQNVNCLVAKATRDGLAARRFVIFVDDLDRVHPETAVEILDVLKNILDIPRCVFVLAIDYDVVTKGLNRPGFEGGGLVLVRPQAADRRDCDSSGLQLPLG